jgi:hypothetical protein
MVVARGGARGECVTVAWPVRPSGGGRRGMAEAVVILSTGTPPSMGRGWPMDGRPMGSALTDG